MKLLALSLISSGFMLPAQPVQPTKPSQPSQPAPAVLAQPAPAAQPVQPATKQVYGLIIAHTGQAVVGASIWQKDRAINTTTTNADGQFILPRPAEQSYYLRVEAPGFVIQDRLVTDTTAQPVRIKLRPLNPGRRR